MATIIILVTVTRLRIILIHTIARTLNLANANVRQLQLGLAVAPIEATLTALVVRNLRLISSNGYFATPWLGHVDSREALCYLLVLTVTINVG